MMHTANNKILQNIPPLQCDILTDVTLLPMIGDVLGPTYTYALDAYRGNTLLPQARRVHNNDTRYTHLPPIEPWKTSSQEVIYGGIFHMHWGHFLIEVLQRLWYTKDCSLPIVWSGVWGVFHSPSHFKSWQKEIFSALGIHNEHIFLTEPTLFAKVHFPEPGCGINTHLHPQHANFLGYYEATPQKGKYIYISRAKTRGCANEEQVETILKKRGWQIIYPEKLSVTEQLEAISSAEVCFMIGGSAQHTLLFTKNLQTRCIVIPREHTDTFNNIANVKSDNYYLFHLEKKVLYSDGKDEANDVFTLNSVALEDILTKTQDFTSNIESFAPVLQQPEPCTEKNLRVPESYYLAPAPISKAREKFYEAIFFYQQKEYTKAYALFTGLERDGLLEQSMYVDYYRVVQHYHVLHELSLVLPLEKQRHDTKMFQQKLDASPSDTDSYKSLAKIFLRTGNIPAAMALHQQLAEHNAYWSEPLASMASLCFAQQKLDEAIDYAQKAVDVEPHNLQRKAELARYLLQKQEYMACKKVLAQALFLHPTWDEGHVLLAHIHHAEGHTDKAIACVKKALTVAPYNINAQEQLSTYLQEQGKHEEAVNLLAMALQQNPRAAERHAQNAKIYEHMGQLNKAIEHGRMAVELEPRNFVCKSHLATYLRKNTNYAEARELMAKAMHMNPFWAEPHRQEAAILYAQGHLDKAIVYARKAVAMDPYDRSLRENLHAYRTEKRVHLQNKNPLYATQINKFSSQWARIQNYIDIFYAQNYLEIGVASGDTFLNMDVPFKVGVDPAFQFDHTLFAEENTWLYPDPSDAFFKKFAKHSQNLPRKNMQNSFAFDVIFIDGLHTFEQTLRDFENSLAYSHEKTLWIIDDTVPSHHFSALDDQSKSIEWKACAGLSQDSAWHGDVFKVIFAIHDSYPEFSYCTQIDNGNPQTMVWRTAKPSPRQRVFASHEEIARMRYEDFLEYAWMMHPVKDEDVLQKLFTNITPAEHKTGKEYGSFIQPLRTDKEAELQKINTQLQEKVHASAQLLEATQRQLNDLLQAHEAVLTENALLRKHLEGNR